MRSLPFCSFIYTCTLHIYSFVSWINLQGRLFMTLEYYKVKGPENIEMRHLHYLGNSVNNDLTRWVSLIWCFFFISLGVFIAKIWQYNRRLFSKFFTANVLFWEHFGSICLDLKTKLFWRKKNQLHFPMDKELTVPK